MKQICTLLMLSFTLPVFCLNPAHFTINRISAPYFIVDANSPATINQAYVGFEVINNSNSAVTYSGLKLGISSVGTSISGQNYSIVSPANGVVNVGTLAPGASSVCYFYVSYPASTTAQATFNLVLSDATASPKTQAIVIRNRSSISANAGGTATQTFSNQDLIGGIVTDDVTYAVGNVQSGDESDFQVAVSTSFDPTKITLLATEVISSTVPGIAAGAKDSLYFITGNGGNGATVTIRWTFRISSFNFTTYLLPCAGATSGSTNYKYALNTSLGAGSPVSISAAANPLTITKTSDQPVYLVNSTAHFTITIKNPGAYPVTIDRITDSIPNGFSYQAIDAGSLVTAANSTSLPLTGATGTVTFEGGVRAGVNVSYTIPAGDSLLLKYTALAPAAATGPLLTTAKHFVGSTLVGSAQNTVTVSLILAVHAINFYGSAAKGENILQWVNDDESNISGYELQRTNASGQFVVLAFTPATARARYNFADAGMTGAYSYYRLKINSNNGSFSYSNILKIKNELAYPVVSAAYPNAFNNHISVKIKTDKTETVSLQLFDMFLKTVSLKSVSCNAGENEISLPGLDHLPAGTYLLYIVMADKSFLQKMMKIK